VDSNKVNKQIQEKIFFRDFSLYVLAHTFNDVTELPWLHHCVFCITNKAKEDMSVLYSSPKGATLTSFFH
jgi:hypothetical protein